MSQTRKRALKAIQDRGIALVYPINNRRDPVSLWYELHPRTKMRWEWDEDGDNRVAELWRLREALSRSRECVYAKWYQGRATFFSRELFPYLVAYLNSQARLLSYDSRNVLDVVLTDSPLSTKQLKEATSLQGKLNEALYNRAMKPLWETLQIVGFGEIDDSSFPSLAVGATESLFEDLWREAREISASDAEKYLVKKLGDASLFLKQAKKIALRANREEA